MKKNAAETYLRPTITLDSRHPKVAAFAAQTVAGVGRDPIQRAIQLYLAVRDGIRYDPYVPFHKQEHYRASTILAKGRGYCVSKASLLCALGRAVGIPTRLGFADVKNHLATRELIAYLGSDLFVYHGYVEFRLAGRWVIATPAFNAALCERHKVPPLAFNGRDDSVFQPYNLENEQFMQYVHYHGNFADIPVEKIVAAWKEAYGEQRVDGWIRRHEKNGWRRTRNFFAEEVVKVSGGPG